MMLGLDQYFSVSLRRKSSEAKEPYIPGEWSVTNASGD